MTNEQINIAISEALGKAVEWHDEVPYWLGMWSSVGEGNESFAEFKPAYDLNAMHEAEGSLNSQQVQYYTLNLLRVTNNDGARFHGTLGCFAHVHATAVQRAEAFLKTIGKWEETK